MSVVKLRKINKRFPLQLRNLKICTSRFAFSSFNLFFLRYLLPMSFT